MFRTLTKADIVEALHKNSSRTLYESRHFVEKMLGVMRSGIAKDGELLISGFGKFEAYAKKPRNGRNPQTGERMVLPARRVLVFRLSRKFRSQLNGEKADA